jgi:hypothetical protein
MRGYDSTPRSHAPNTRGSYGRVALDRACEAIISAPNGAQEFTLHRACYAIGGLIAGGTPSYTEAIARLVAAAKCMPTFCERWTGLERKVKGSVLRGMKRPREPPGARERSWRTMPRPAPREPPQAVCVPPTNGTTTAVAMRLWREGVDPRGTLAERYLVEQRKLVLGDDLAGEVLRWHSGASAMLALFRNILTGEPQAISRIVLDRQGRKIERKFLGPTGGAAVMLDPFDSVTHGLIIGEGVETCLAARQLGLKPAWALGSAGAVETFPVLGGVACLTILAEHCERNARAVEACGCRWHAAGCEVLINRSAFGKDLNDALMEHDP